MRSVLCKLHVSTCVAEKVVATTSKSMRQKRKRFSAQKVDHMIQDGPPSSSLTLTKTTKGAPLIWAQSLTSGRNKLVVQTTSIGSHCTHRQLAGLANFYLVNNDGTTPCPDISDRVRILWPTWSFVRACRHHDYSTTTKLTTKKTSENNRFDNQV